MKLKSLFNTPTLEFYTPDFSTPMEIPFMDVGISAGFPSPADDFIELSIDLNKTLLKNKDTTFFAKVKGIKIEENIVWLVAENEDYKPIKVTPENEFMIWGIVINSIKFF